VRTWLTISSAALVLLFSFQNCQKPPHPDEISSSRSASTDSSSKIDLNLEPIKSLQFSISDKKVLTKNGNTFEVIYNKSLHIDLDSGAIEESNDLDSGLNNYCLPSSMKDELVSILRSSQVCRVDRIPAAGQVCSQAIVSAYASLVTSREQFDLGYAASSCSGLSVDLCDEQPQILKAYIQAVKSQYQSYHCP